jgi:hypothetical protein
MGSFGGHELNVERLHAIAKALSAEFQQTDQVPQLVALQTAITNQVNSPQDPTSQQQVAAALQALEAGLAIAASNDFAPNWRQVIEELGIEELLGSKLLARLAEIFARNQITPTVARDEITQIVTDAQALVAALEQLLAALVFFNVGAEELEPGEAEVGVTIPRLAVKEELPALGTEFEELQKILGPFLELAEGSRSPLKVRTISSSDFAVFVAMTPGAALSVAMAMDKILDVYKKILEIRRLHHELANQGVSAEALEPIQAEANARMAAETERVADEMVDAAAMTDGTRANELKIELRLSLNALANRVDHGYNIDVRAQPEPDNEENEDQPGATAISQALHGINELAPKLAFVNRSGQPILRLPEGTARPEEPDNPETAPPPV